MLVLANEAQMYAKSANTGLRRMGTLREAYRPVPDTHREKVALFPVGGLRQGDAPRHTAARGQAAVMTLTSIL